MTGFAFTPGPWKHQREEDAAGVFKFYSVSSDTPQGHTVRANVDTEANARLIAAAPEMAALLDEYLRFNAPVASQASPGSTVGRTAALLSRIRGDA